MRLAGPIRPILALALIFPAIALSAQTATEAPITTIQVPRLIRISGVLVPRPDAAAISDAAEITFALYAEETGGEPLWQETQRVEIDAAGHYSVLLGSAQPEGLPLELFNSAQAQWLGVTRPGEAEQPRIMLVSVPFALKAGDAETLGGKPSSAFALAGSAGAASKDTLSQAASGAEPASSNAHALTITGSGTTDYLPMWTSVSALANSPIFENKTTHNLGVGTTAPKAALEVVNNTETPVLAQTSGAKLAAITGTNTATTGTGSGVYGASSTLDGAGVYGTSSGEDAAAVWGAATATSGSADGVYGTTLSPGSYTAGVWGTASDSTGGGNGVVGRSAGNDGGTGVWGYSTASGGQGGIGVYGQSEDGAGVWGKTTAPGQDGVVAVNRATTGNSNGLYVDTSSGEGVGAFIDNAAGGYIIVGTVDNNGTHMFHVDGSGNGYFAGNVQSGGGASNAGSSFRIDDPIDPAEKFLNHSSVESPDMKNIYDGNITTDEKGLATVVLPGYFEALNRDFRYQLTVMGQFAQAIVASKIAGNRFVIQTSKPNVEVSWQVTGIRQDPWANAHRIPNEEMKPAGDRGYYLHPELYGSGQERSINVRHATQSPAARELDPKPSKVPSFTRGKE